MATDAGMSWERYCELAALMQPGGGGDVDPTGRAERTGHPVDLELAGDDPSAWGGQVAGVEAGVCRVCGAPTGGRRRVCDAAACRSAVEREYKRRQYKRRTAAA